MASLQGKKVLIVDDDPDIRIFVKRILEADGAKVIEAESIDRALEVIEGECPHLVITDLLMPEKTGFDLLRARATNKELAAIPTLVLSGRYDKESVVLAVALGAADYLVKPIKTPILLQKVRKHLRVTSFLAHTFAEADRPRAIASIPIEILEAGEGGLRIEASAKLAPDQSVAVEATLLDVLGARNIVIRTARPRRVLSVSNGRYLGELNFVGIGEAQARVIRDRVRKLR